MPKDEKDNKKGEMTVQEAGQKGGEATSESHDRKFYEDIGRKGGEAPHEKRGEHGSDNNSGGKEKNKDNK
jgi:general stress protein YciG